MFLDRDGTLNHDEGYTHDVGKLRLLEHVVEGLQLLSDLGLRLIITTNQSGIARGIFTERQMRSFNDHLIRTLGAHAVTIDGVYYCPYHPSSGVGRFRRESPLRKPRPGMLLQAAREHHIDLGSSFMVGDKKSDVMAGQAAGCTSILVLTGAAGLGEPDVDVRPDHVARDLLHAATIIRQSVSRQEFDGLTPNPLEESS